MCLSLFACLLVYILFINKGINQKIVVQTNKEGEYVGQTKTLYAKDLANE